MPIRRSYLTALLSLNAVVGAMGAVGAAERAGQNSKPASLPGSREIRKLVEESLALLQSSSATYIEKRDCFSCHHQALPAMAIEAAAQRGLGFDRGALANQAQFTLDYFGGRREKVAEGSGVPGGPYTAGYALVSLAAAGHKADETTAALAAYLEKTQRDDGSWRIRTHRPPLEDSDFTATALAVWALALYPPQDDEAALAKRIERGRKWLEDSEPVSNEDFAFRLLGLRWADADEEAVKAAQRALLDRQRDDGGWSQLDEMESDAYATGQALAALAWDRPLRDHDKPDRERLVRGLAFLVDGRLDDASWQVTTRSRPIQRFFESGFPHGKSQFISASATAWAAMALVLALDEQVESSGAPVDGSGRE